MPSIGEDIAAQVRGEVSAQSLLERAATAADLGDGRLGAFVRRFDASGAALALDEARVTGRMLGPLHGVTVAVKDMIDTAESHATGQSPGLAHRAAVGIDAAVVARLRAAGALVVGQTTTMELGAGLHDPDSSGGVPRNPWDEERWPGGSSSGSAIAVASGMATVALGTDTGGSVRCPSALCGVTGMVPTHGTVPSDGMLIGGESYETIGPIARTAQDCDTVLQVLQGVDPAPILRADVDGLRIGVLAGLPGVSGEASGSVDAALSALVELGAETERFEFAEWGLLGAVAAVGTVSEHFAAMVEDLAANWELFGTEARRLIASGAMFSAEDYLMAQRARAVLARRWLDAVAAYDVVCLPATPTAAPLLGELDGIGAFAALTSPINALGWPVVAVPSEPSLDGLPLSMQIVGRPGEDRKILAIAHRLQQVTSWHLNEPVAGLAEALASR